MSSVGRKAIALVRVPAAREHGRAGGSTFGRNAFTLVEIMVVLLIIAVLTTIGAVQYAGSSALVDLKQSGRAIEVCAQYAHNYAITRHCATRLLIDPRENRFVLQCQDDADDGEAFVPVPGMSARQALAGQAHFGVLRVDSDQAELSEGPGMIAIRFTPTGSADAAVIEIVNGRRMFSLVVHPSTGRTSLVDGKVDDLPNDKKDLDV